ncbi:C1 protein [Bhendi yellow vein mosaic betasatellite [India:Coimbator:OYCO1:2005]]|uniref:C1 protein n=1 Tax=Bhendi yellow vein mosaic betasatellite [India:Coimbator:OYCO1:2005] TaxID=908072 RepID=E7BNB9_9VIRU|nr:C1 protein [Bhendi yellow vein mosaic betasatellite [India:Coimbator:OYCO1:2005]]ADQ55868.1 C1 protein [Bhendi yellow vein mosaic betasatellite [India:Coimbator:OYCO1:2005]]
MTRFSRTREGIVIREDVRDKQQQRASVHKYISSAKWSSHITKAFIVDYAYQQLHIPFDFTGVEGEITSTFKFHYWGSKAEEILEEDIIHVVDIIIMENPDIMVMEVNEPVIIDSNIII